MEPNSERAAAIVAGYEEQHDKGEPNAERAARAAEVAACYSKLVRTEEEIVIRDLISDLGHLADRMGLDFLEEARAGIGSWADEKLYPGDDLGPMGSEHHVTIEVQQGGK